MSKRKTGSHTIEELEMKDTVSYNAAVQYNPSRSKHQNLNFEKGAHQKGPSGEKGGEVQQRKRK